MTLPEHPPRGACPVPPFRSLVQCGWCLDADAGDVGVGASAIGRRMPFRNEAARTYPQWGSDEAWMPPPITTVHHSAPPYPACTPTPIGGQCFGSDGRLATMNRYGPMPWCRNVAMMSEGPRHIVCLEFGGGEDRRKRVSDDWQQRRQVRRGAAHGLGAQAHAARMARSEND
ncbi:hypothetical protein Acsp03_53000 [Actinomadura sp. NBRC 104412]|nr:hypothetical protein Acsp03_53000 [Actinomadura sp. NBRC 104412]